jgi:hypothetical protein
MLLTCKRIVIHDLNGIWNDRLRILAQMTPDAPTPEISEEITTNFEKAIPILEQDLTQVCAGQCAVAD